jgi:hypothetical protein
MTLEARKLTFIQEILSLQNEEIIFGLESFLKKQKSDYSINHLQPKTMAQYESEIDQAMSDSKNDRMIKATELKAKIKEWH